jgi:hypothetical protein
MQNFCKEKKYVFADLQITKKTETANRKSQSQI